MLCLWCCRSLLEWGSGDMSNRETIAICNFSSSVPINLQRDSFLLFLFCRLCGSGCSLAHTLPGACRQTRFLPKYVVTVQLGACWVLSAPKKLFLSSPSPPFLHPESVSEGSVPEQLGTYIFGALQTPCEVIGQPYQIRIYHLATLRPASLSATGHVWYGQISHLLGIKSTCQVFWRKVNGNPGCCLLYWRGGNLSPAEIITAWMLAPSQALAKQSLGIFH